MLFIDSPLPDDWRPWYTRWVEDIWITPELNSPACVLTETAVFKSFRATIASRFSLLQLCTSLPVNVELLITRRQWLSYSPLFSRRERMHTITVAQMVHSHTDSDSRGFSTFILLPDVLVGLNKLLLVYVSSHAGWVVHGHEVRSISRLFSLRLLLSVPLRTCFSDDWSVRTDWCVCTVSLSPGCVCVREYVCVCMSEYSPHSSGSRSRPPVTLPSLSLRNTNTHTHTQKEHGPTS